MERDRFARTRIREYLSTHGPLEDPTGYATSGLKDAVGYRGTGVAFIQLIAAMDRDGEIVREVRGKRTYRISGGKAARGFAASPASPALTEAEPRSTPVEIDYDRLARAVVREFLAQIGSLNAVNVGSGEEQATVRRLQAERDEYARRLETARVRLGALFDDDANGGSSQVDRGEELRAAR